MADPAGAVDIFDRVAGAPSKPPAVAGKGDIFDAVAAAPSQSGEQPSGGFLSTLEDVGKGALKGAGHSFASVVHQLASTPAGPAGPVWAGLLPAARKLETGQTLEPQTTAQKVGYTGEQIGEYFVPAGVEAKAARAGEEAIATVRLGPWMQKVLGVGVRAATGAASTATVAGVQKEDVKTAAELGAAGPVAEAFAGPLARALSEKLPGRLVNSLIRPGLKDFNFGKNPGAGVASEGIAAASADSLAQKIVTTKHSIGALIDTALQAPEVASKTIDVRPLVEAPIHDAATEAIKSGDQKLLDRLRTFRDAITGEFDINAKGEVIRTGDRPTRLAPFEAAPLKRDVGAQTRWRDPLSEPYNEILNQVRVRIYGNLNDAIDAAAPGTKALNARYANLLGAEKSLEKSIKLAQRKVVAGLGDVAIGAAAGIYGGEQQGSVAGGIADGLIAIAARHALASTAGKTVGAQLLRKTPEAVSAAAKVGARGYLVSTQKPDTEQ